jgi:hypothetical protein
MDGRGAAAKLSGAKSRPYDSRFAAHVLNSFFSLLFHPKCTHTHRERERRKISGCIQRNVDLREKVERTEMRERKRRPRWPGDGWDEEKLPSSLSLSSLSLLYNNTQRTNNLKGQRLRQCGCKETDRPRDFLILLLP